MSTQQHTRVWFETAAGARFDVPENRPAPINIGRIATPGSEPDGVGIPHGEASKFVSRKHASLWRGDAGAWEIADAGSSTGLWIDGIRAEAGKRYPLTDGTKVRLGSFEMAFRIGQPAAEAGGEEGGTMVLRDFQPSAPVAPPVEAVGPKSYLDIFVGDQILEIAIPAKPGVSHWTVGRAIKSEGNDPSTDHVSVPNLPELSSVSRRHVLLTCNPDGSWTIKNLSSQGCSLNHQPLLGETPVAIAPGDKIIMGSRVFIFRTGAIRPHYSEEDFAVESPAAESAEMLDTRELPVGGARQLVGGEAEELAAWGQLVENKLMGPKSFPLRKRRVKIGSHPINSDIKLDESGISDLHATIEWHGKDCKIHSKAHDAPVRVNHATYRVSPPLKTGAVITIGNQEYHIDITGLPPEATSTLVVQRVRRLTIFCIFAVLAICMGTLLAAKTLTPRAVVLQSTAPPTPAAVVRDVVQSHGLAGIALLKTLDGQGLLDETQRKALEHLQTLARVDYEINKTAEREFRQVVGNIEQKLKQGREVFLAAGVDTAAGDPAWYKGLQEDFLRRQREAYSSEWSGLLTALRDNNLSNAQRMLGSMTNTQQELLDQAATAIARWDRITTEMTARSQEDLLDKYMDAVRRQQCRQYLAAQRTQLGELVKLFVEIENDPSETSDALMQSNHWPLYKEKIQLLDNSLKSAEAYQTGALGDFDKAYEAIPDASRTRLLKSMRQNLAYWVQWQSAYGNAGDASAKPELIAQLSDLKVQFSQSMDPGGAVLQQINSRLTSLQATRGSEAARLRQEAAQLPEGFDRLNKLLDAFRYDASFQAETEIDALTAKMCGIILRENRVAQEADNLNKIRDRMNGYVQQGLMNAANVASIRQIESLLKR